MNKGSLDHKHLWHALGGDVSGPSLEAGNPEFRSFRFCLQSRLSLFFKRSSHWRLGFPSMGGRVLLDQRDQAFFFCLWTVFHAARHNVKVARLQENIVILIGNCQLALKHEESFVFALMFMPNKLPFDPSHFDHCVIHVGDNHGGPGLATVGCGLAQISDFHGAVFSSFAVSHSANSQFADDNYITCYICGYMKQQDILRDLGHLALASRLKRLADALLADAAKVHSDADAPLQPGQFPLIAALDRYGPMSVNDAAEILGISQPATTRAVSESVKIGLVTSGPGQDDKRFRELSLTELGRSTVADMKRSMWPRVEASARGLTQGLTGDFLDSINQIEGRLLEQSMLERVRANTLSILPYSDALAPHFQEINLEWIEAMFIVEPHDHEVLSRPKESIIDKGGEIHFVCSGDREILGTCALEREPDGFVELTKMGVRAFARGKGAGEFLLRFILERTRELGWQDRLFLVSNKRNVAAVRLYEKLGFEHDAEIMNRFGARYDRCDVAMRYRPSD